VGTTAEYAIIPVNGANKYRWTLTGQGCSVYSLSSALTNVPSVSVSLASAPAQPCSLSVAATSCGGTSRASEFALAQSIDLPPSPVFAGNAFSFCAGIERTIQVNPNPLVNSYTYSISGTGWTASGSGTSVVVRANAGSPSATLSVVANGFCGNSSPASLTLAAPVAGTLPAVPSALQLPTSSHCTSSSAVYRIDTVAGVRYLWSVSGNGWSVLSNTNSYATIVSGSNNNTAAIFVTARNNCGTSSSVPTLVRAGTPPNFSGGANNPVSCPGVQQRIVVLPVLGAVSYTWSLPVGWTGSSDSTVLVVTPTAGAQAGQISVVANNACGTNTSLNILVGPALANTITPVINPNPATQDPQCLNSAKVFWATTGGVISPSAIYSWSTPSNWGLSDISTLDAKLDTIQLVASSGARSGLLSVSISDGASCGSSTVNLRTGDQFAPGRITGPILLCPDPGLQQYDISGGSSATTYTFRLSPSAAGTVTQIGNRATVSFASGFVGNATLLATTVACGFNAFSGVFLLGRNIFHVK
jgi:hypothetical protein